MGSEQTDVRARLRQYRIESGMFEELACSSDENKHFRKLIDDGQPLPRGVFQHPTYMGVYAIFCRVQKTDLEDDEMYEYLTLQQLDLLRKIKNYLLFFVILASVGLAVGLAIGIIAVII